MAQVRAYILQDKTSGHVVVASARLTQSEVRAYAIEVDREYALDGEDFSDKALWKRNCREGWRVVPVTLTVPNGERE